MGEGSDRDCSLPIQGVINFLTICFACKQLIINTYFNQNSAKETNVKQELHYTQKDKQEKT